MDDARHIAREPRALDWEAHHDTGVAAVDAQHRVLVGLVNRLVAAIGTPGESDAARRVVDELADWAVAHFETEEAIMAAHRVDPAHVAKHVLEHRRFCGYLLVRARSAGLVQGEAIALANYLVEWLTHHVLGVDKEMGRLVLGNAPEGVIRAAWPEQAGA